MSPPHPAPPLSQRLRGETRALHQAAERAGIMAPLLRGEIDRPGYAALLGNLQAIYGALEGALATHAAEPALAAFDWAPLARSAALAADLAALRAGPAPLQPATRAYAERLERLSRHAPQQLVAHAYVRYLGDLNGGQLLRRIVGNALALGPEALHFYDFGTPQQVSAAVHRFRAALDAFPAAAAQPLVDEARWSFAQHVTLFEQLDQRWPGPHMRR